MKNRVLVSAIFVLSATAASAGTPPSLEPFTTKEGRFYTYDNAKKEWIFDQHSSGFCFKWVEEATKAGVADDLTLDIPYDTPDWKAGKHTFAELKAYCVRARRSFEIKQWLIAATGPHTSNSAGRCVERYEADIKDKTMTPSLKLPFEGMTYDAKDPATGEPFTGTVEDVRKKFCDPYAKEFLEQREAKTAEEAPYRKALKADKLDVYLNNPGAAIYGPGYKELTTAAALAKSTLWFRAYSLDDNSCKKGQASVWTVRRYQFDAKHKLVKDTAKDYCGKPTASAFK